MTKKRSISEFTRQAREIRELEDSGEITLEEGNKRRKGLKEVFLT